MKQLKKITGLLILMLFCISSINIPVKAAEPVITSAISGKSFKLLESTGGTIRFTIRGTGLLQNKMKGRAYLDGVQSNTLDSSFIFQSSPLIDTITCELALPANKTDKEQVYSFEFSADDGKNWFKDGDKANVNVKASGNSNPGTTPPLPTLPDPTTPPDPGTQPNPSTNANIFEVTPSIINLTSKGGEATVTLRTDVTADNKNIKAKATLSDEVVNLPYRVEGANSERKVIFTVPENIDPQMKEYTVLFNANGSDTQFSTSHTLTIKVEAMVDNSLKLTDVISKNTNLPLTGGKTNISVRGENLESSKLTVKAYKILPTGEVEVPEVVKDLQLMGLEKLLSGEIIFPASKDGKEEKYEIRVSTEDGQKKTLGFRLSDTGFNGEYADLLPKDVSVDKVNDKIIIQYNSAMSEVKKDIFKSEFLIDLLGDGNKIKLNPDDTVVFEESRITITTSLVEKLESKSRFTIPADVLKDSKGRNAKEYSGSLNSFSAVIFSAKVIEGEVLSNNGGNVIVELDGANLLAAKSTMDTPMEDIAKFNENKGTVAYVTKAGGKDIIRTTIEGQGSKQTIKFTLPENTSDIPETYIVRISLDGGLTYSSKEGVSSFDFGRKLSATVLPKNVTDSKAPILSHMTIQSYGTSGGSDKEPDTTHTDVPVLQESKKTLVHVFGANLDSKLTKIRVRDERGVLWYPVREPNSDSMDQFILVAFGGPGIAGNGNTQIIELICPRNLSGDNKYTYEVAVDGINYNSSIVVTATVLDDKAPGKFDVSKELREINVSYVDTVGKPIENAVRKDGKEFKSTEKVKGYSWLRYKVVGIVPPELEGYTLKPDNKKQAVEEIQPRMAFAYSLASFAPTETTVSVDTEAVIGNNTEVNFVYEKNALEPTPVPDPVKPEPTPVPDPVKPEPVPVPNPVNPEPAPVNPEPIPVTKPVNDEVAQNKTEDKVEKTVVSKDTKKENVETLPETGSKESGLLIVMGVSFVLLASFLMKKKPTKR